MDFPRGWHRLLLLLSCLWVASVSAQDRDYAQILIARGKVEFAKAGTEEWKPVERRQKLYPGDRLRTGVNGCVTLRQMDKSALRLKENSTIRIDPPAEGSKAGFAVQQGSVYLNSREQPGDIRFRTRLATGAIRGTELHISVAADGTSEITLIDGAATLKNDHGELALDGTGQATVVPGQAPQETAKLDVNGTIQWALYYPAIVPLKEFVFTAEQIAKLKPAIDAYAAGALAEAAERLPANWQPVERNERLFQASLELANGRVAQATNLLASVTGQSPIKLALNQLISVVQGRDEEFPTDLQASTQLSQSYRAQSQGRLGSALELARGATDAAPDFGFAWTRVAELEFSFGRIERAEEALAQAIELSPRNAQAFALRGFLLSAARTKGEKQDSARAAFETAIQLDDALANAWLGRGLLRIRSGDDLGGREDLHLAATLEPNRSVLRSYLGKAWHEEENFPLAGKEFELAKRMDPADPTPWLYDALLSRQENRINDAIRNLERSIDLNDNRAVYRSRLLLDQDRAVRAANLANIYRDAGMEDVAIREAARAAQDDPTSYSAHLFLAESFNPDLVNLRFESVAFSEYLVANLLAPVSAGNLTRNISQQEYSSYFEQDSLRLLSSSRYLSRGLWQQTGAIYATGDRVGASVEVNYLNDPGQRNNDDLELFQQWTQLKVQATPEDTLYLQAAFFDTQGGDRSQQYIPANGSTTFRFGERQEPNLIAGGRHEWSPGAHTLFLAGRLTDTTHLADSARANLTFDRAAGGAVAAVTVNASTFSQSIEQEIYTAEVQHIHQVGDHSTTVGGRVQAGGFDTVDQIGPYARPPFAPTAAINQNTSTDLERFSAYAYHNWRIFDPLLLTAGLVFDHLEYPLNYRFSPVASGQQSESQLSPKAGFIWNVRKGSTLRGSYAQSLGGASFEQSVRLEPAVISGFVNSYRSLMPESIIGLQLAPGFETFGLAWDEKLSDGVYFGVSGELLKSSVTRDLGYINQPFGVPFPAVNPAVTRQFLDYEERDLKIGLHKLVGDHWVIGARYDLSVADLHERIPEIPAAVSPLSDQKTSGTLQSLRLFVVFNHPAGWFGRGESVWYQQSNQGFAPARPGDDFWQFNLEAGYRFPGRKASIQLGVLNLTDRDFRLNPINFYSTPPRERTFALTFKMNF